MDPGPDQILSCPHCDRLYRRATWLSENNYGYTLWSDGQLTTDDYPEGEDPVVRCVECKNLFVAQQAITPNRWGYSIPKEIKISRTPPVIIEDCQEILTNETLLYSLGESTASEWYQNQTDQPENKKAIIAGEVLTRIMIWRKLNDEIRFEKGIRFSSSQHNLFFENAEALIPILPDTEFDKTFLMLKAELLRNLGRHVKSIRVLLKVKESSFKKSKQSLTLLNLLRVRKLVILNRNDRRSKSKLRRLLSWIK